MTEANDLLSVLRRITVTLVLCSLVDVGSSSKRMSFDAAADSAADLAGRDDLVDLGGYLGESAVHLREQWRHVGVERVGVREEADVARL